MVRRRSYDYDVIIIGSGAGGGVAAHMLAREGKKIALIEDDTIGGECPNFGCVPTKALLQAAEYYRSAARASEFGIKVSALNFNYAQVKKWKDLAVHRTGTHSGDRAFSAQGISVVRGHAHFVSPHEVSTGHRRLSAQKFLVATGTRHMVPPIEGLDETGYLTYRQAIDLTRPLKKVFVIGGGAIGCEFADLFAAFGAKVTLAEFAPRLMAREDREIGELLEAVFEHKMGMDIHTGTQVTKVQKRGRSKIVHFEKGGVSKSVTVDEVMLATGKAPNVDLGLENAGVAYTKRGIGVNHHMQTSAPHIYAAGDVTGVMMFTHVASYQSRLAAHNMFAQKRNKIRADYSAVPRAIFVTPEVAAVGLTETEIRERGWRYKVGTAPISVIGRANTADEDIGFVKIIAGKKGHLLGASIVAPRAGEIIHELTVAIQNNLTAEDVAHTIHAFPTWSEAVRIAAAKIA